MYWVEGVAGTSSSDKFSLLLAQSYHFPDLCSLASGPAFITSDDSSGLPLRFCFLRAFCVSDDFPGQGWAILRFASHPPAPLTPPSSPPSASALDRKSV